MDGTTPGYPEFGYEQHQPSALVRHLLGQAGLHISEAMACGFGGGIGFLYAVFEYKDIGHPLLTIVAQHHPQPWLEAAAGHLGITTRTVTSSSAQAALHKLDSTLAGGQAAQLAVVRAHLPWHGSVSPLEEADAYPVVVAGMSDGEYLVDDGRSGPHPLEPGTLAVAWAAYRKGKLAIRTVDPLSQPVELAASVTRAIATTVQHLEGPVLGHAYDVNLGLSGMRRLAADMRDATGKTGWARRFGSEEAFTAGMSRLAECLTSAHTAPGGTRPLYSVFLREAAEEHGLPLVPAAELAGRAGVQWEAIAESAAASLGQRRPGEAFADLADRLDDVVATEERLVEALKAALG